MQVPCITFVNVDYHTGRPVRDFVIIENAAEGCFSNVGRTGGEQTIGLNGECFKEGITIPVHELLHSLGKQSLSHLHHFMSPGFVHEQSRPDRDDYILINKGNIKKNEMAQFQKRNWTNSVFFNQMWNTNFSVDQHFTPYDIFSVMHYK